MLQKLIGKVTGKKKEEPKCIHSHDIATHPSCFAQGLVKDIDVLLPWYKQPGMNIGYLDIETDNLKADFGTTLTWCIKDKDGVITSDVITQAELFNGTYDKRLIQSLINEMNKYSIIVTYYGTGFDIPWIRSKALHYNLDMPGFVLETVTKGDKQKLTIHPSLYHWDLYYVVKSKLNLSRKSLDNACDYLGIVGKTPIDKDIWRRAKYGDKEAIAGVLSHNEGDVVILEKLHNRLTAFSKWNKTGI